MQLFHQAFSTQFNVKFTLLIESLFFVVLTCLFESFIDFRYLKKSPIVHINYTNHKFSNRFKDINNENTVCLPEKDLTVLKQ